jgi:excisionase family DNA binding protein
MPNTDLNSQYASLRQASSITQLSTRTLRRAITKGHLHAHRIGRLIRIELAELERWVKADGQAAPAHGVIDARPAANPLSRATRA